MFPVRPDASDSEGASHPTLRQRPLSPAERRGRWEVRAAQWRALELAESIWGVVPSGSLLGVRTAGVLRGLLHMQVPFEDLDVHQALEARFLAAAGADPVLSQVGLVYVFGAVTAGRPADL